MNVLRVLYTVVFTGGELSLEAYANWLTRYPPSVSLDTCSKCILVSAEMSSFSSNSGDNHVPQPGSATQSGDNTQQRHWRDF